MSTISGTPTGPLPLSKESIAEHLPWLRAVLLARLRDPQATAEVLQEVAASAARQLAKLRDPAKLAPWLYRIALVAVLQHRRREGRRRVLTRRYADMNQPSEHDPAQPDPLDWLLATEQHRLVREALQTLPPRDAEALLLKYSQDWSYQQIASHLGVSIPAVEGRLHRARARLRSAMVARDPSLAAAATR